MSKKFLTVFALAALLAATMTGAAFANAGDVTAINRSGESAIGALKPATEAVAKSADLYYIDGAKSLDIAIEVSFDSATTDGGSVSADISANEAMKYDFTGTVPASKIAPVKITIGGFTTAPNIISVDKIRVETTPPTGTGVHGQLLVYPRKVTPAFDSADVTFEFNKEASKDFSVVSFDTYYEFTNPALREVSSDGKTLLAKVVDGEAINSGDKGYFSISFDKGVAKVVTGKIGAGKKGVFTYALVADKLVISEDAKAKVAGVDTSDDIIAKFTVTVKEKDTGLANPAELTNYDIIRLGVAGLIPADKVDVLLASEPVDPTDALKDKLPYGREIISNSTLVSLDLDRLSKPKSGANAAALVAYVGTDNDTIRAIVNTPMQDREALLNKSLDIYYQYVAPAPNETKMKLVIGSGGEISWKDALDNRVVTFDDGMKINYVVVDEDNYAINTIGRFLVINDGKRDQKIIDPLWIVEKTAETPRSGSGVGCDAGLGAFALLGLAGTAFLRKKN